MALEVRPVRSRSDLSKFIKLPFRLYKGQPNWVPPLLYERKRHLDRNKNPFFDHAEAEYFLAWRDGRPVGRITAHVDQRLNEVQQNEWGLFGFFECEDDQEAADALIRTAEEWNRERGRDRIIGPFDFSTNHECGLLVDGHELKPLLDEGWAWIAERDGQTIGAALTLLDWNEVLIGMNGRLFPIGWLKFLIGRKKIEHVRVFALGVKPEYQHTGVAAKFYIEHFDQAAVHKAHSGEMGWILEANKAMNRGMEAMGGRIVKTYRIYEK